MYEMIPIRQNVHTLLWKRIRINNADKLFPEDKKLRGLVASTAAVQKHGIHEALWSEPSVRSKDLHSLVKSCHLHIRKEEIVGEPSGLQNLSCTIFFYVKPFIAEKSLVIQM